MYFKYIFNIIIIDSPEIRQAEEDLGFPLIISVVGGSGGGRSELTKEGLDMLNKYQNFIDEVKIDIDKAFKEYF